MVEPRQAEHPQQTNESLKPKTPATSIPHFHLAKLSELIKSRPQPNRSHDWVELVWTLILEQDESQDWFEHPYWRGQLPPLCLHHLCSC